MDNRSRILILALFAIVAFAVYLFAHDAKNPEPEVVHNSPNGELVAAIAYSCDDDKTISAEYYDRDIEQPTTPGEPPIPGGTAILRLSDERTLTLPQTISGSGVRYANASESIVFWNKGNAAILMEGGTENFKNCKE